MGHLLFSSLTRVWMNLPHQQDHEKLEMKSPTLGFDDLRNLGYNPQARAKITRNHVIYLFECK